MEIAKMKQLKTLTAIGLSVMFATRLACVQKAKKVTASMPNKPEAASKASAAE